MKVFDERGFVESQFCGNPDWIRYFGDSLSLRIFQASEGAFAVQISNDDCVDYGDPNVCTLAEISDEATLCTLLDALIGALSIACVNRLSWRGK